MTDDETTRHPMDDRTAAGDPLRPADAVAPTPAEPDPTGVRSGTTPSADPEPVRAASGPTLTADPNRPADPGWREPPWFPPRDRKADRPSNAFTIVVGLILVGIGLWYFLDRTLGLAMPRVSWGSLWPLILIVLGGWILVRSFQRKA